MSTAFRSLSRALSDGQAAERCGRAIFLQPEGCLSPRESTA